MSCCNSKTLDGFGDSSTFSGIFTADAFSTGGPSFTYTEGALVLTLSSQGTSDIQVSIQESFFTKIGNHIVVTFAVQIAITDNTVPGAIVLSGFPFGPNLSFGTCELAQAFGTIVPAIETPVQGFLLNGEMTFYRTTTQTAIETDLTQNDQVIIGSIAYNYSQPDL